MLKYEIKQKLRTSDYDSSNNIKIHSLCEIFQDLAGDHAALLNMGYTDLINKDLIWVLRSQYIKFNAPVPYDEELTLRTWPKEKGRADFIRYYEVETKSGQIAVEAVSKWVIVNYKTRKLERASAIDYNGNFYNKYPFEDINSLKISIPHNKEFIHSVKVLNDDIDHNGHMNNCAYVRIIYNYLSKEELNNIKGFHIDFLSECMLNDTIDLYKFKDENNNLYIVGYVHLIQIFIAKLEV